MNIRQPLKGIGQLLAIGGLLLSTNSWSKQVEDFNFDWRFHLEKVAFEQPKADLKQKKNNKEVKRSQYQSALLAQVADFNDSGWQQVQLPHDFQVALPFDKENGAACTGFKTGGVGWYRKSFTLPESDQDKQVWLEFDGVYKDSDIWLNGHHVGGRPYGYASFSVDLTPYLNFGKKENVIAVKVDHRSYVDSRWYTGAGIYRNVKLVKTASVYVPQWGIQVTTPEATSDQATVNVSSEVVALEHQGEKAIAKISLIDGQGNVAISSKQRFKLQHQNKIEHSFKLENPTLWQLDNPHLYTAKVELYLDGGFLGSDKELESDSATFGVRTIRWDANKGFFLNEKIIKLKGVNLHHEAGAMGAAVPKSVWRNRLAKLKAVGVNAIRMSHNPHSTDLMDLCDEMGFLVNAEVFDEWNIGKPKGKIRANDRKISGPVTEGYPLHFDAWAERDTKDMIRRDFNRPSIIMWSLANEIEWTFPYYQKAVSHWKDGTVHFEDAPDYDREKIKAGLKKYNPDPVDNLPIIMKMLAGYVKDVDTTRPVTAGLIQPSVDFVSGVTDALDIIGINYRWPEQEAAHKAYPNAILYGSENWGTLAEWRSVEEKEYIAGFFIWTGFAYKGEAGPYPRMGLAELSMFDFVGHKLPMGHFFETIWVDKPKSYLTMKPADQAEFAYDEQKGWYFKPKRSPRKPGLHHWEWFPTERNWKYADQEPIVVQAYTNTEEAELFLNGKSLGRKKLADFNDYLVIPWLVPYQAGELRLVGYNQGKAVTEDTIGTHGALADITLAPETTELKADGYDVAYIRATLVDAQGLPLADSDDEVEFEVTGPAVQIFVDNGSEYNVQDVLTNKLKAAHGSATLILQTSREAGEITVVAKSGAVSSQLIKLMVK